MLRTFTVGIHQLLLRVLRRFANHHYAAVSSRHRATNHQQVVLGIDARYRQTFGRDANVAHVTRRSIALDHARRVSRSTDRTGRAHVHRTVRLGSAIEVMTLDRAGETATF